MIPVHKNNLFIENEAPYIRYFNMFLLLVVPSESFLTVYF
jgi:hypothetical protein